MRYQNQNTSSQMSVPCIVGFCLSLCCVFSILPATLLPGSGDSFIFLALVSGISGMIVSISGVIKANSKRMYGQGFGIAGIVLPIAGMVLVVPMMVLQEFVMSFSNTYNGEEVRLGACDLLLDSTEARARSAMLWNWYWDGDPEHTVIEIPDEYSDGIKIRSIGERAGVRSMCFRVKVESGVGELLSSGVLKDSTGISITENPTAWGVKPGTEIHTEDLVFTVKVGKNIDKDILDQSTHFIFENEDGSITYYIVSMVYEVAPENPKFYSSEGKLYYKSNDKEVNMNNPRE